MSKVRTATCYLQIEGTSPNGQYDFGTEAVVRKVTQKKPEFVHRGCIVVKVKIAVPSEAWEPYEPEVTLEVPLHQIERPVLEVVE